MALLPILEYPDPRLKKVAGTVTAFTADVVKLVQDMAETMYAAPGVGLAATQVDVHKRIIVIDVSDARDDLVVLVNPEIITASGEIECEEGCLSVPGYFDKVVRAARVTVRARVSMTRSRTSTWDRAWPADRRMSARRRARSSVRSKGLTR